MTALPMNEETTPNPAGTDSQDEWFYADAARQQHGPVSAATLIAMHARGELRADALAWRAGMEAWQPLKQVLPLGATVAPAITPPPAVDPLPSQASIMAPGAAIDRSDIHYAGFWRRFAASVLDSFVVMIASYAVLIPAMMLGGISITDLESGSGADPTRLLVTMIPAYLLMIALQAVYYAWMHSRPAQATLGKMAVGIKLCRPDGTTIGFWRGIGRYFGMFLSAIPLYLGFIMAGFTDRKRALHDMVSDTVFVDRWAYTAHPQLQKRGLDGVTIAVLVIYGLMLLLLAGFVFLLVAVATSGQWQ